MGHVLSDFEYEIRDGIGFATLNRPEVRNALTFEMYDELAKVCREATIGGPVTSIIVSGSGGKAFAAGTDMKQFLDFSKPEDALGYEARVDQIVGDIEKCPVPTIAAITGACTGGGAAIAAACDIRICDQRLKFGFPIAQTLGNCLSISNLNRLLALIGAGRLRELLLTARLMECREAEAIGLVSAVLEDEEAVQSHALEIARNLAANAPQTMRASKEALRRLREDGSQADGSDLIIDCYMSADFKEGIDAFLNKRKPQWKGR